MLASIMDYRFSRIVNREPIVARDIAAVRSILIEFFKLLPHAAGCNALKFGPRRAITKGLVMIGHVGVIRLLLFRHTVNQAVVAHPLPGRFSSGGLPQNRTAKSAC
jgi:hypothetical protein